MGLPIVDYVVIVFFLSVVVGIGLYFSKFMKGGKDFFIGGNLIPWWAAGISLYMTTFSAWMFTGAASFAYNTGWFGFLYFFAQPVSFFIGFQLSAHRWRRTRVTSPVEYIQTRFNKTTQLAMSILLSLALMYWPAHHLASLSKICAPTLFPNSMVALDIMIVGFAILVLIYSFFGGLWAVCITDVVQYLILMVVCSVLVVVCFTAGEVGTVSEFVDKIPPIKFHHVIRDKTTYTHWFLIGFITAKVFGNAVGDRAQRYYSVIDEKAARKVGWLAFALFMTGPILFGVPPLVGKVLWPDISMLDHFANITKPDENIYIAVVLRYMPAGVIGLFLSAMMAASMSALDSVWNTVSSIISVDIYKNLFRPHATDREVLWVGRYTILGLSVIAVTLALIITHSDYGIFTFSNIFFGLTGVPTAIPLLLGIMIKNISRWSAIASIIAGTLTASVARFAMHFSLGPQYLLTVAVTLLFLFMSMPMGRLYNKRPFYAVLMSGMVGLVLWLFSMGVNSNPDLSFDALATMTATSLWTSAVFWVAVTAVACALISLFFSRLYAREQHQAQPELEHFFKKMDTPVDVQKEVLSGGAKETNIFPLVGSIAMGFSALTIMVLISPAARSHPWINIAISAMLFVIGFLMLRTRNRPPVRT